MTAPIVVYKDVRTDTGEICFVAEDPSMPGAVGYGTSEPEAKEMLDRSRQAILRAPAGPPPSVRYLLDRLATSKCGSCGRVQTYIYEHADGCLAVAGTEMWHRKSPPPPAPLHPEHIALRKLVEWCAGEIEKCIDIDTCDLAERAASLGILERCEPKGIAQYVPVWSSLAASPKRNGGMTIGY